MRALEPNKLIFSLKLLIRTGWINFGGIHMIEYYPSIKINEKYCYMKFCMLPHNHPQDRLVIPIYIWIYLYLFIHLELFVFEKHERTNYKKKFFLTVTYKESEGIGWKWFLKDKGRLCYSYCLRFNLNLYKEFLS